MEKDWKNQRNGIIGLGEKSFRKSYYPDLRAKISELESANKNLLTIFNSTNEGVIIHDIEGNIIANNKQAGNILNIGDDNKNMLEIPLKNWDKQKLINLWHEVLKGNPKIIEDEIDQDITDAKRYIQISINQATWNNRKVLVAVVQDISDKKKNEQELESYRNNLEKLVRIRTYELESTTRKWKKTSREIAEKNSIIKKKNAELRSTLRDLKRAQSKLIQSEKMASLGILTAGVAHEINNPLNYIHGGYSGLREHLHEQDKYDPENLEFFLSSIKVGIDRVSEIVKGLNQFSRNSRSIEEECNLHSIIDNCLLMLHNTMKNRIRIEKNYTEKIIFIKGNTGKLHQVFLNLLNNAQQSIEDQGDIMINTSRTGSEVKVEIADNGHGISNENLPKIIEPFFTTKDPGEGTGLGLAITYNIIKEHKGHLIFRSKLHKGTRAIVTLPG